MRPIQIDGDESDSSEGAQATGTQGNSVLRYVNQPLRNMLRQATQGERAQINGLLAASVNAQRLIDQRNRGRDNAAHSGQTVQTVTIDDAPASTPRFARLAATHTTHVLPCRATLCGPPSIAPASSSPRSDWILFTLDIDSEDFLHNAIL